MAVTTTKRNIVTTEGDAAYFNFDGIGKTDAEITELLPDTTEVPGFGVNLEVKSKGTTNGDEYSAPGKRSYEDREVKFLMNDKTRAMYGKFLAATQDKNKATISAKFVYAGYGDMQYGDFVVSAVNTPNSTDATDVIEVTVKLKPSGQPKFTLGK
ncbi:hypothetical protein HLBENOHH_02070 [Aeromonas dhakensis]|uniref:hypothetical protein n=1 Tax=Aeromonas TaxID=642 RepID=UPI002B4936ED|nr:hypothetical protein [Aeromonas veronii]